jgi:ABC-type dipeptide/oligopeptide/nickel transport system ATPase component
MNRSPEDIARALGNGKESKVADGWITRCPAHDDGKASLSIRSPHGKILFKCHAGCTQQEVMKALQELDLWPKKEASEAWRPIRPVPKGVALPTGVTHFKHGSPVRTWVYYEQDGSPIGLIHRFEKKNASGGIDKTLIPMSYCYSDQGGKKWTWKSFDKPRPFYNLPDFKNKELPVIVFEGEKAADAGKKLFEGKYICTSWPGGAAAVKYSDVKLLKGRKVILWPDNDEPGWKAMNELAEMLIEQGDQPYMVPVPPGLPEGWDVADDIPDEFDIDFHVLVSKADPFVPVSDADIAKINREYAFIVTGGKSAILYEKKNTNDGSVEVEYWSVETFKQYFANQTTTVGKNQVKLGDHWLGHPDRRTYRGLIFEPGVVRPEHYNLWQGYSFEPDGAGDWSIFHEHLVKNVCNGDEELFRWVFGWFADIIQNPGEKPGTSLSLRGEQGSGKTIVGKIFGRLIKRHYTLIDQERYLFGNFNSHMASTILLHSDEGFWGGDPRHVGKLKSLVTSDTQRIEQKGRDSLQVNNYLRLLITSNEDWVVPAAFEERRFGIIDVGNGNQQDQEYFITMLEQMKNGGYGGLLYDLMNFDLKSTDIRKLPETSALAQQKETSMGPVETYWFTCLQQGNTLLMSKTAWLDTVKTQELHEDCINYLNKLGYRRVPHLNAFFKKLRQIAPADKFVRKLLGPDRQSATTLPTLQEARDYFDKVTRTKHDWFSMDINEDPDWNVKTKRTPDGEIPF